MKMKILIVIANIIKLLAGVMLKALNTLSYVNP